MTDLITLPTNAVQKYDDKAFEASASAGNYLPRLQLMTSNSQKCKDGLFPINNYALVVGEVYNDLGKEVDVLLIAWRPKAIEMGDAVISVYDHTNPEFQRIAAKSEEPESKCMFGPEFLIYVPSQKKFATFFCGSKSSRKEAPAIKSFLLKAATFKAKQIKTAKYSWWAPMVTACSTPFDVPAMPDVEEQVTKFNNPPAQEVERAPDTGPEAGRAR